MPRVVLTLLRMIPAVAGASAAAVLGLVLARLVIPADALRASNAEVGNYLQALGTIYAVVAAFVVYVVWGQYNDARTQVDREASEVMDMFRIAEGFPAELREALQVRVCEYADTVIDEIALLAKHDDASVERTSDLLDEIWSILHACEPASEAHKALHAEALTRFNDLSEVRTARLSSAHARIPQSLRLLLYIGGAIVVGSMYLIAIDRFWLHALITAALAAAIAHVVYIVDDLDNPFDGDWRVSAEAFERARRYIQRKRAAIAAAEPAVAA
jgi:hypothetical protein